MKTICKSTLSGVLAGILAAQSALAAPAQPVPSLVNYQGYITDAQGDAIGAGAPVNRKVLFKVYGASAGGVALWTETHTATLSEGRFSVLLGNGAQHNVEPHGDLNDVFASTTATEYYVGITVDNGDGTLNETDTEISPRQRIVSSVFSLRAASADSVTSGTDLKLGADSGLGYYDAGNQFNGASVNGPVVFGGGGGILGTRSGGTDNTALSWDTSGNVSVGGALSVTGNVTGANLSTAGSVTGASINTGGTVTGANITTAGTVTGGNITTAGAVNAGSVNAGTLSATGAISGSSVTAGGNIGAGSLSSTGNLSVGGDVNARLLSAHSGHLAAKNPLSTYGQGLWLEWNRDGGSGVAYIMNQDANAPGGISFGDVSSAGTFAEGMKLLNNNLTVTGNITTAGDSVATGSGSLHIVSGVIKGNGSNPNTASIISGSGFTLSKSHGAYRISFPAGTFTGTPAVTANLTKVVSNSGNVSNIYNNDREFVTIYNPSASFVDLVLNVDGGGHDYTSYISFIAVGTR